MKNYIPNKLDSLVPFFSSRFLMCTDILWSVLKRESTNRNMKISFICLTFLTLLAQSKSNDDLPKIQVTVLTKGDKFDHYAYSSSRTFVGVEVGDRIYFTCQSRVPHRIILFYILLIYLELILLSWTGVKIFL